jgi:uncharacterized protein YndB with AHSA1/START domain
VSGEDTLVVEFEVHVPVEQAFTVWTRRAGVWWPRGHTVSGDPESIVFGPGVGGRIVERGRDGVEHEWGVITAWKEPHEIGFSWVHVFDPSQATQVSLTFSSEGPATRIRLEQSGFAALGAEGQTRRARTGTAWGVVMSSFSHLVEDRPQH